MKKKLISVLLAMTLSLTAFVGCGSNETAGKSSSSAEVKESSAAASSSAAESSAEKPKEIVKLNMILLDNEPARYDEIFEELNKMLREDIGVELEAQYYGYDKDKYGLLFTGTNNFDLVYTAAWMSYSTYAGQGAFYELTEDFIKEYAPKTWEAMPSRYWEQAKVGGSIYMVPQDGYEFQSYVQIVRGDLRKAMGIEEMKTKEDYHNFLLAVKENYPEIYPVTDNKSVACLYDLRDYVRSNVGGVGSVSGIVFDVADSKATVFNEEFSDWKLEGYTVRRQLADEGIISEDFTSNSAMGTMFENGLAAVYTANLLTAKEKFKTLNAQHPEWELELYEFSGDRATSPNSCLSNGMAINAKSEHPELAMQVIDLLRNDPRYYYLTYYGIEGKDYENLGDGTYRPILTDGVKYNFGCNWGWRNDNMALTDVDELPFYLETLDKWKKAVVSNPATNFVADISEWEDEIANIKRVSEEYAGPLNNGQIPVDEIPEAMATLEKQLKAAGNDEFIADLNRQMQDYLNSLK